jgi:ankyrin repeat protein
MLDLTSLNRSRCELNDAVSRNDLKRLAQLLNGPKYLNLNYLDKADGQSPLHKSCRLGHLSAAQLLVEHGASPHIQDSRGWFPLHLASFYGHVEIVVYLLGSAQKAPTHHTDCSGSSDSSEEDDGDSSSDLDEIDAKFCVFSLD